VAFSEQHAAHNNQLRRLDVVVAGKAEAQQLEMVARIASRADDRSNANALMITRVERDGVELVGAVKRSAAQRLDSDVGDLRVAVEAVETRKKTPRPVPRRRSVASPEVSRMRASSPKKLALTLETD